MSSSNYDINSNESYHKELVNVMKTIYAKRNEQQFNVPSNTSDVDHSRYLSQKCINIALPYFQDNIKKVSSSQTNTQNSQMNQLEREMTTSMNTQINRLSDRPQHNTRNNDNFQNTNTRYEEMMKSRGPVQENMPQPVNFNDSNNQESNDDVQKRYSELTKMRENEYVSQPQTQNTQNTNTFQHPSINVNEQFNTGNASQMNNNVNLVIRENNRSGFQEPSKQFNTFPQTNPNQIGSDLNNNPFASNSGSGGNSLEDQFKNITDMAQPINTNVQANDTNTVNMIPDNVDYSELMKQMEMPNPINNDTPDEFSGFNNINEQFQTSIVNSQKIKDESIVPDSQIVNSNDVALEKVPKVNTIDNTEFQLLKDILQSQQVNLDDTNRRINDLVTIMEKQDVSSFYDTIINIPSLISKQKEDTFVLRKHNLVISSRDRDFSNKDFNKYDFKVEFGVEGDSVNSNLSADNSGPNAINRTDVTFVSSAAKNPNLVDVLKNVVEIKVSRVILPRPRDQRFFPDPYYFISIEEFDSNVLTTKRLTNKVFCKIHFDKEVVFGGIEGSAIQELGNQDDPVQDTAGEHYSSDDGRKYLYYKNDDGDKKVFYNAPLASLNKLSIKILDSRGRVLGSVWGDSDRVTTGAGGITSDAFYYNTFTKDEISNLTDNSENRVGVIESTGNHTLKIGDPFQGPIDAISANKDIINLTNQVEIIFEVTTKDKDLDGVFKAENL